ncbi:MAG: efflux RND transporter periplasmic adaptor subunit [Fluviicola sp.]
MKKEIIIPIATAILGILMGFFIFSGDAEENNSQDKESKEQIWTCSMHPQIRKTEPGDCPICGMDLIPLEDNAGDNPLVFSMTEDAIRIANIQTTVVGSAEQSADGLVVSGRLTTDETSASSLVSHIPGRIEKLYLSFTGERVYEGQKIAMVYSPNLISAQGELLEALKIKDSHPELLEAAKNKLRYWKIPNSEINEIIKSRVVKEYFNIYSEHTGVVTKRKVSVGDYVSQGGVLFDLQNLTSLWAVFDVYEKDLASVKIGDEISFRTPAIKGKTFKSKVVFIDPLINPETRTASIRLEVPNSNNQLKPDMFITGTIQGVEMDSRKQVYVPKSAVLWTGERSVVYVKLPGTDIPSFEFREVLIGNTVGKQYEVLEGLTSGEEVVTNGAFVIDASAQLNNRNSMMNRNLLGVKPTKPTFNTPDYLKDTPDTFKKQLNEVVGTYLKLKDALVESKYTDAKTIATQFKKELADVEMKLLNGEAHMYWMEKSEKMKMAIALIISSKNIDLQRASFDELSVSMISAIKAFTVTNDNLYIQYCSMADSKKGAYWLSKHKHIRNPYYGDQMLTCGEVKDSISINSASMKEHNHK